VVAVLGPSGCGKSTLLRLIAGLERPDGGSVALAGSDVTPLPAHRRDIGMVFQDHALFPHLDVRGNVAFGLVEARWPRAAAAERVAELLEAFGLTSLARRRVDALSGGERQRVALCRALAPRPRVLLLDEPLASLDRTLRERLAADLARSLHAPDLASVFVTHDQDEALTVGDDLVVMRAGRVAQAGPAGAVVTRPVDAWVARFLGHRNVFDGPGARRLPGAEGHDAVMLRDDLVRIRAPRQDARDHAVDASVRSVARDRHGLRLELWLSAWQLSVSWRGAERELWSLPVAGDVVRLVVPPEAWLPLASDPGPTKDGTPPGRSPA
jgi:ABC-type Fe3+/spermidine/putrescine transport system ATPase subunit